MIMRRRASLAFAMVVLSATTNLSAQSEEFTSDWMSKDQFQDLFDKRAADGFYPDELQGDCQDRSERFRATWKRSSGGAFYSYTHMSKEVYQRLSANLGARGYQ